MLSHEDFTSIWNTWDEKAKTLSYLVNKEFREIHLVIYFRRQDTLYESVYQQGVKQGDFDFSFSSFKKNSVTNPYDSHLNWYDKILSYLEYFDDAKLHANIYELSSVKDLFHHFCQKIGIKNVPENLKSEYTNPGYSDIALRILDLCQKDLDTPQKNTLLDCIEHQGLLYRESSNMTYGLFRYQERIDLLNYYHESNKKLFKLCGINDESLLKEWEKVDNQAQSTAEVDIAAIKALSNHIISHDAQEARFSIINKSVKELSDLVVGQSLKIDKLENKIQTFSTIVEKEMQIQEVLNSWSYKIGQLFTRPVGYFFDKIYNSNPSSKSKH